MPTPLPPNPFNSDLVPSSAYQRCLDLEASSVTNPINPLLPLAIVGRLLGHLVYILFRETGDKKDVFATIVAEILAAHRIEDMVKLAEHYIQYLIKPCKFPSY